MTGRAKWDAWNASGKKWPTAEQAEARYLELAQSLGWTEGSQLAPSKAEQKPDDDDIWDDDSTAPQSGRGFGITVSSMAGPVEVVGDDLHGLAVSNQIAKLEALVNGEPRPDLDAQDEYVRRKGSLGTRHQRCCRDTRLSISQLTVAIQPLSRFYSTTARTQY